MMNYKIQVWFDWDEFRKGSKGVQAQSVTLQDKFCCNSRGDCVVYSIKVERGGWGVVFYTAINQQELQERAPSRRHPLLQNERVSILISYKQNMHPSVIKYSLHTSGAPSAMFNSSRRVDHYTLMLFWWMCVSVHAAYVLRIKRPLLLINPFVCVLRKGDHYINTPGSNVSERVKACLSTTIKM